ncbi:hypothetical protein J6590_036523 [Homalodisca vitripennis]|nr:hypothetical protein J6590_036523 [Homalodisca vitripennis]
MSRKSGAAITCEINIYEQPALNYVPHLLSADSTFNSADGFERKDEREPFRSCSVYCSRLAVNVDYTLRQLTLPRPSAIVYL